MVAEQLVEASATHTASQEARERSARSRAYYAAFHAVLARAEEIGCFTPTGFGSDHGSLRAAMKKRGGHARQLAGQLEQLVLAREWADYRANGPMPTLSAVDAIALSRNVIRSAATWR